MFMRPKHLYFAFVGFTLMLNLPFIIGCGGEPELINLNIFDPILREYSHKPSLRTETTTGDSYIVGKALAIASGKYRAVRIDDESPDVDQVITLQEPEYGIDDLFFTLPTELRPKTPEEVKTIIRLEYSGTIIGNYGELGDQVGTAHKISCTVSIIDRERNAIVGNKTFVGDEPQKALIISKHRASGYYKQIVGSFERAGNEILQYVTNLPRRP